MPVAINWPAMITDARNELEKARKSGDELKVDLAEAVLNDLLDGYFVTVVTRKKGEETE